MRSAGKWLHANLALAKIRYRLSRLSAGLSWLADELDTRGKQLWKNQKKWAREETLAALYLYISLPSNMVDDTSKDV